MTDVASRLVDRFGKAVVAGSAVAVVAVLVVAGYLIWSGTREPTYTITAQFPATPGLYKDNAVDILGVPKGTIESVTPKATPTSSYVEVRMSLPASVHVPANAQAVLMAPNPVSDRFVELTPPYTGGAVMAHGATIPLSRTIVPLELDDIYQNVDQLAKMLGPKGANSNGQLSAVLHAFAKLANGNGADVHNAITTIAAALPALTKHPEDLKNLIDGLDTLTRTLASHDSTIDALYGDLATATTQLADEGPTLATAVANLQQGLAEVAQFIKANQASLGGAVQGLNTTVAAVMGEQQALIKTFDTAPLGFQNFNRAIDPNTACPNATGAPHNCPSIWARADFTSDAFSVVEMYCGDAPAQGPGIAGPLVPILLNQPHPSSAYAIDSLCGLEYGALQHRASSPGAPKSPDLDLTHYLGTR